MLLAKSVQGIGKNQKAEKVLTLWQNFSIWQTEMVKAKQLLDFIPVVQSFAGIKSDTVKCQGINYLAAAERGVDIYDSECSG